MAKNPLYKGKVKDCSRKKGLGAAHKDALRTEAKTRQSEYDKLTLEQKVARLDAGGFTATKQRAKLAAQLVAKTESKTNVVGQTKEKINGKQEKNQGFKKGQNQQKQKGQNNQKAGGKQVVS